MIPENMDVTEDDCKRVFPVLARVGSKRSIFVIILLSYGPLRFNELRRHIGAVSQRMLTHTLRGLENDGLLTRTVYPTVPARVEYELTPLGHELGIPMKALGIWIFENLEVLEAARKISGKRDGAVENEMQSMR